jgi:hypothetical protein
MKKNLVLFSICALLIVLFNPAANAQGAESSSFTIDNNFLAVIYPDSLIFHLTASSSGAIEGVALIYGTNGRSCQSSQTRQELTFRHDRHVDLSWNLEFKDFGLLPPGSEVWWQWEVITSDGGTETTPKNIQVINDKRVVWHTLQKNAIILQWQDGSPAFGTALMDLAEKSLARLVKDIGVAPTGEMWITVYPSASALQEAAHSYEWTGGVAFPEYSSTMIGIRTDEMDWAAQVIPHELSHLVVDNLIFNCHGVAAPTWLDEGLAVYAEDQPDQADISLVKKALSQGELPSLSSLAAGFSAYSERASLSYAESSQVVTYLIKQNGAQAMGRLLDGLHSGETIDEDLKQVYGLDTDGLDAAWRVSMGYSSQAAPVQDLSLASSPTTIPTLALSTSAVKPSLAPSITPSASLVPTVTLSPATVTPTPVAPRRLGGIQTPIICLLACLGGCFLLALAGFLLLRIRR